MAPGTKKKISAAKSSTRWFGIAKSCARRREREDRVGVETERDGGDHHLPSAAVTYRHGKDL